MNTKFIHMVYARKSPRHNWTLYFDAETYKTATFLALGLHTDCTKSWTDSDFEILITGKYVQEYERVWNLPKNFNFLENGYIKHNTLINPKNYPSPI